MQIYMFNEWADAYKEKRNTANRKHLVIKDYLGIAHLKGVDVFDRNITKS